METLPVIGEKYPFFDDGKITPSRLYVATINNIIPFEKAKTLMVDAFSKGYIEGWDDDMTLEKRPLVEVWGEEKIHFNWIFADETDYFIEATVKEDVYEKQYFARTKGGGWFSMGIADCMVGGRLDVSFGLLNSYEETDRDCYFDMLKRFK